jgi:hypothetical protein
LVVLGCICVGEAEVEVNPCACSVILRVVERIDVFLLVELLRFVDAARPMRRRT